MGFDENLALTAVHKHGGDLEQCLASILPSISSNNSDAPSTKVSNCKLSFLDWITRCEQVLHFFASYKAAGTLRDDTFLDECMQHCLDLFKRDGDIVVIENYGTQELCDSYPIKLVLYKSFLERMQHKHRHRHRSRHTQSSSAANNTSYNNTDAYEYLCNLLETARFARVHRRFIAPVIFLPNHACIARSSTLSTTGELLLNKASSVVSDALNYCPNTTASPMGHNLNALRGADIELLRYFDIKFICDLMVEDKKKVGWGRYALTVTSSEKVDREQRYKAFHLSCMPYPGCEFFRAYKECNHNATNLVFEWNDDIHDAKLNLHWFRDDDDDDHADATTDTHTDIEWAHYKQWDIVQLTQNYLRLILDYVKQSLLLCDEDDDDGGDKQFGVLVHCISGWDRTPLFVCLLRLSLWADGVIHGSLDSAEILYLTLCYDWLLFTHQFGSRLLKGEHIFHFTFYMLQFLMSEQYSVTRALDEERVLPSASAAASTTTTKLVDHRGNICHDSSSSSKHTKHKLLHKMKRFGQRTKSQTKKLVHSKSSSIFHHHHHHRNSVTTKYAQQQPPPPKSKPIAVTNCNTSSTSTSHNASRSWEKTACAPLTNNIRHSYIPTMRTPPTFAKSCLSSPAAGAAQLQWVKTTQPMITRRQQTPPNHQLACAAKNVKIGSWQFVENRNDSCSPMFQIISTPKSQATHTINAPPELKLDKHINSDRDSFIHTPSSIHSQSQSSSSCEDIKLRNKYSLSAPSSTKKYESCFGVNFKQGFVTNASLPLPTTDTTEVVVDDTRDRDLSESHSHTVPLEPYEDIAKSLVDDVIHNVVSNMTAHTDHDTVDELPAECTSLRLMGGMHGTKSTPVTISDYLGLESKVSKVSKVQSFEIMTDDDDINGHEQAQEVKIDGGGVDNDDNDDDAAVHDQAADAMTGNDQGRLIGSNRSERLMQVYTLFNKIYTQVMVINDPPIFYKQGMMPNKNGTRSSPHLHADADDDDMAFMSNAEKYASQLNNPQSEPYTQITNYLKSILPVSFMGGNEATASTRRQQLDRSTTQ
eukprot:CAMPEP_0202730636 /NCGR_PEP_ID=MMETSP1385-20130828/186739_1 /ASSEMBLY_ACC=CAM_ASM_000861 /TAXON_ID=933848 /ORGANISM="Elphidium margaritaceum" /LENGTH=1041 /DNA_ID=CAMNT_0049396913 /DNA_START=30 /DNA_END=3155 /DNA_ORIENTATION=-